MLILPKAVIDEIVARALSEDLPDIIANAIFEESDRARARFVVKSDGVLAGLDFAAAVFAHLDASSSFARRLPDGSRVRRGDAVATVEGSARALLAGERTALNLLQRASGIATKTARYVDAVRGTNAKIYDTRKTAPGLRMLDKYAVTAGGGENHRIGLFDMFLIKNNHIDRVGSIRAAVDRVRASAVRAPIMVEVRTIEELDQALAMSPDFILLDNMSLELLRTCVERVGGRIPLEASGGVTLETVSAIAATGVDRISVGALTHSVSALDISMRIEHG